MTKHPHVCQLQTLGHLQAISTCVHEASLFAGIQLGKTNLLFFQLELFQLTEILLGMY